MEVLLDGALFFKAKFLSLDENPSEIISRYNMPLPDGNLSINYEWLDLRRARDGKITETDWTQILDVPLSSEKKIEFAEYRQALRDLPQNFPDPNDVIWPGKPTL